MDWILQYSLFLFDFDGLLVDTEHLHYEAYVEMCARHGFCLNWSFDKYTEVAQKGSTDLRDQIYAKFPALQAKEGNWQVLYEEKKQLFLELVENKTAPLLPGASDLLLALEKEKIKTCVVTHSPLAITAKIRRQNPILETICHWITREDYVHAKPAPDCYQLALFKYGKIRESAIGFEDSARGLQALLKVDAKPVFVCPDNSIYLRPMLQQYPNVCHYQTLSSIDDSNPP